MPGGLFCVNGNPLSDGTWTYEWINGRQLQKMQKSGETVEFVYNENGLRVQKTATTTGVTKYTLHGKNVVHMTQGSNELHFFYDAQNKPAVVVFNGTPYSYVKNLQGDIVAILDSDKNIVVSYVYDAWGRPISCSGTMASTLGKINPFRYRGYVYDEETGQYYLRNRFYNTHNSRCISADSMLSTRGTHTSANAYAYSRNAPTIRADANGQDSIYVIYDSRPNATSADRITEYNFTMLSEKYQDEQQALAEQIAQLKEAMAADRQTTENTVKWLDLIKRYVNPTMLTAEMLNELIEKIVIHETVKGEGGQRTQKVEIYYRFVGKID